MFRGGFGRHTGKGFKHPQPVPMVETGGYVATNMGVKHAPIGVDLDHISTDPQR